MSDDLILIEEYVCGADLGPIATPVAVFEHRARGYFVILDLDRREICRFGLSAWSLDRAWRTANLINEQKPWTSEIRDRELWMDRLCASLPGH